MLLKAVHEDHYHDDESDDTDDDSDDDDYHDDNEDVPTCAEGLLDLCPISSDCSQMMRR